MIVLFWEKQMHPTSSIVMSDFGGLSTITIVLCIVLCCNVYFGAQKIKQTKSTEKIK